MTTPYHPEANGLVERLHRRLKEALIALGADHPEEWFWKLPCVLLSIRTTFKPDLGACPADLVYGEGLAVPGELLSSTPSDDAQLSRQRRAALSDLRLEVARFQPTQTSAHRQPRVHLPEDLATCTHVFVRRGGVQSSLSSPYIGPYRVVSRNDNNFRIAIPGRQMETVSISRVKPATLDADAEEDPQVEDPPPPGRPPRRPPTRQPDASSRQTRQGRRRRSPPPPDARDNSPPPFSPPHSPPRSPHPTTSGHGGASAPSASSNRLPAPRWSDRVEEELNDVNHEEGEAPNISTPTLLSTPAPAEPEVTPAPPNAGKKTLSFSKPRPGNFSYRKRPDVSALNALVRAHLEDHPSVDNSVS